MAKTYQYSLRFAIDPYNWDTVKEAKLIDFCKQGQIDNVVFFINPEELNQGHPTLAQVREHWLPTIKSVAERLAKMGITTSLNPWTTLMHSDRGHRVPQSSALIRWSTTWGTPQLRLRVRKMIVG